MSGREPAGPSPAAGRDVRPEDLVAALLCLAAAGVAVAESVPRYFGRQGLGPGAFPTWVAVLLAACAATLIARAIAARGLAPAVEWPRGAAARRVGLAFASLVVYLLALPLLGFSLASAMLLLFHFRWLGGYSWPVALPTAFGLALVVWYVFGTLLFMPLPAGPAGL